MGLSGLTIRYPFIVMLALCGCVNSPAAALPSNPVLIAVGISVEFIFGIAVAMIPLAVVSSAQLAGHLTSSSMGLQGAQLFDPTAGGQISDISRILGDLAIVIFLLLGGHYVAIAALSGLSEVVVPGAFSPTIAGAELLIDRTARIFELGVTLSMPVLVALLLAQFVMAIISRSVPTINIFIVSYPVTIGLGMLITIAALPEIVNILQREFVGVENATMVLIERTFPETPKPGP
jgi:flagellar biosynthetic protein FliR